jgi:hypothetical protein
MTSECLYLLTFALKNGSLACLWSAQRKEKKLPVKRYGEELGEGF